jgi:hypothetical protein
MKGKGRERGTKGIRADVQCKTCSIKVPTQDITWCVPEGGGGPKYSTSRFERYWHVCAKAHILLQPRKRETRTDLQA